jgi:hypothetical protein
MGLRLGFSTYGSNSEGMTGGWRKFYKEDI